MQEGNSLERELGDVDKICLYHNQIRGIHEPFELSAKGLSIPTPEKCYLAPNSPPFESQNGTA